MAVMTQERVTVTVNILHIGVGIRGSHWLQFVAEHADTTTVGCVDADADALERARARVGDGCATFSSLEEALASTTAKAALIASPSSLHAQHAVAALEAGLHVMIEKPFATSVTEGRRILDVAKRVDRQVVVAENYRYWPAERTIRSMVREGRLGRIHNVTLVDRRNMPSHTEGPWLANIDYPQLGEIAIHHFDSLRAMLLSEAHSISAHAWNPTNSDYRHGACSAATILMDGALVQYLGTMTSPRYSFSLRLEGDAGEVWTNRKHVLWRAKGKRFFRPVKNVQVPPGDEKKYPKGGTTSLLSSLTDAVERGLVAETSGEDNLGTLAMVEAAKRSDAERRQVDLAEVLGA